MDYEELRDTLTYALPMNRKERFYTGTVLPSLLFHNGFSNLYRFLEAIPGFPKEVNEKTTGDRFLFYTEYNLKESAGRSSVGTQIFTATRDTPDVVIHILEPVFTFVVIEAKMFAKVTQAHLDRQIEAQRRAIIDVIKETYAGSRVFHIALVPGELKVQATSESYQVLNWEFFVQNEALDLQGNPFVNYLKYALDNYDDLASKSGGKALTVQAEKRGMSVYMDYREGKLYWIGRSGGRAAVENDVKTGVWRSKSYGINDDKPRDGRKGNWMTNREFAEIVRRCTKMENSIRV